MVILNAHHRATKKIRFATWFAIPALFLPQRPRCSAKQMWLQEDSTGVKR